ncbi:hypothetical protein GEMRC1_014090 [Eukaryota sp. GEM-RC1]
MQQTAFEAKIISSSGDVMNIAYELNAQLAYLHNSTFSAVQNEERWCWKEDNDHCFVKNDSSLNNFDVSSLYFSFLFEYIGTKQAKAGECSLYRFDLFIKLDLCFSNGVLFQECYENCYTEPCEFQCFDYVDHKEISSEDKRFDPQELDCDHFEPVVDQVRSFYVDTDNAKLTGMYVSLETDVLVLTMKSSNNDDAGLLLDGDDFEIWSIGHDICSVAPASPTFDGFFFAHDLLLTDKHVRTGEKYESATGECSWFNTTSNRLCMNKGYIYALCLIDDDDGEENCMDLINHKHVKLSSPIFNPYYHCPVLQKTAFEARVISATGDEMEVAYELNKELSYLHNTTHTIVQANDQWFWKDVDQCFVSNKSHFDYLGASGLYYSVFMDYVGPRESKAGECSAYRFDFWIFTTELCFSKGVLFQECHNVCDSEPCEFQCFDYVDHKEISSEDKRFDPQELDCDHFEPVVDQVRSFYVDTDDKQITGMYVSLETDVLVLTMKSSNNDDAGLLLDGDDFEIWSIGHDICSVAPASPTFDGFFFAHDLLLTDKHVRTGEKYESATGECSWFNTTSNRLCMNKGYIYALCLIDDDDGEENCMDLINHKHVKLSSPIFNPYYHCPVLQKTAFEARVISATGDEMEVAYELNKELSYLHNTTHTIVQANDQWFWKDVDQCFVSNKSHFDYLGASGLYYSVFMDYVGPRESKAGECSAYRFDFWIFTTELCFSKGDLFQECHNVCDSEPCEFQCFDYVDHKEISSEDKRFDPQELDCDHFEPVVDQVRSFYVDTDNAKLTGMYVSLETDVLVLTMKSSNNDDAGLLLDGDDFEIWSIGHDICSVAPASPTFDGFFFAHDLLLTDKHVRTGEKYESATGECSWFNTTSNRLCMNKGYIYALCLIDDDDGEENCMDLINHKHVKLSSPIFNPYYHCPVLQKTAFEARVTSATGDEMEVAYELNKELSYLHNTTHTIVQANDQWFWKDVDQCFVSNKSHFDYLGASGLYYSVFMDYVGPRESKAGECSAYRFDFWIFTTELCFSKGVLFQECHNVCDSEPCEFQCFDYVDHKEISSEDKRFDPQELDCDHFEPVVDQVRSFYVDTDDKQITGMYVSLETDVIVLTLKTNTSDNEPGLLLDGDDFEIWSIGHDICSVAPASPTFDGFFFAHDLLLTDQHVRTGEKYESAAGECSWFNTTSNRLCMNKGYIYALCLIDDDDGEENCMDLINHKHVKLSSPIFNPYYHCPVLQKTAFEARVTSATGDEMEVAYELNKELSYLHNTTHTIVQANDQWFWKDVDQCFVSNKSHFDYLGASGLYYSVFMDYVGPRESKAGECSAYRFDFWIFTTELCFSKGVLFQECHNVCDSEPCEFQCFDYVDHKEISSEDKRFDPQELDCDHFEPVVDQVRSFYVDTDDKQITGMYVSLETDVIVLTLKTNTSDNEPGLLLDGDDFEIWSIGHDICSVAPASPTFDGFFFAHDLLLTDQHVRTGEKYESAAGECSWFNTTSNRLCMNKGYVYVLCLIDDGEENCMDFVNHKHVKLSSPIFNPYYHCPVMQKTAFEARVISTTGEELDVAYELNKELSYLHNTTHTIVQANDQWFWKDVDQCFVSNKSHFDYLGASGLSFGFFMDYVGPKETTAGECSLYRFDIWILKIDLCFSKGVLFQECHQVCEGETCETVCFDYVDHKEISSEDKRFNPEELDCDHFDPVEIQESAMTEYRPDIVDQMRELFF